MPSPQDCAERLREQAYRTLLPQIKDLEEELQNVRSSLTTGIHQLGQKLDVLRHIELPTTDMILGEILGDVIRQKELETSALALFARGLHQKETQEEILEFLLDAAQKYFPRMALFTVRGDRLVGWSSRGYSESAEKAVSCCSFPQSDCPQFRDAFKAEDPLTASSLPDIEAFNALKEDFQGSWRIFALRVMQKPAAILVAADSNEAPSNPDALSILMDLTALRLENIALKILFELASIQTEPAPSAAIAAAVPEAVPAALAEVPETQPPAQVEVEEPVLPVPDLEFAPEPVRETTPFIEQIPIPEPAPMPEAASVPEPMPMPEPAPIPAAVSAAPPVEEFDLQVSDRIEVLAPPPQPVPAKVKLQEIQPISEEDKLHADAKRFARLLVSEIKLYNEKYVAEGRANRDLYIRLKKDIDRSRDMYEKRISPIVTQKIDYFHDEIIRILGDNDPSTLGIDYPGPRVDS
jgi:hypothetical protein